MSEDHSTLAAKISNWPSKAELAKMFEAEGYAVDEGRYSVRLTEFDHFVFQELGGDLSAGCITADHVSTEALVEISQRVSQTLAKEGVRHRFEVYSGQEEFVVYLHQDWPKDRSRPSPTIRRVRLRRPAAAHIAPPADATVGQVYADGVLEIPKAT